MCFSLAPNILAKDLQKDLHTHDGRCTPRMAEQVENLPADSVIWSQLYKIFQHYIACDNGGPAEQLNTIAVAILIKQWIVTPTFTSQMKHNKAFFGFIIRHVNVDASRRDLDKVRFNTKNRYPPHQEPFCRRLIKQI